MLTLFLAPGASPMAAHIALHEAGAVFEARPLSFRRREHRSAAYLALNPAGQAPTLLIDGRPLAEVDAILFFLARRFPEGAEAEAQALSWMSFAASTLHPARRGGLDHAMSAWTVAENRMAGPGWLLGRCSVADIHLFRLFWRFNGSLRPDLAAFPNLAAHHDRMLALPAVERTIGAERTMGYELLG